MAAMKFRIGRRPRGIGPQFMGVVLLVWLLAGCGYHFTGAGPSIYPQIRSVYVDTFMNRTSEANADNIFRTAFSSQIVQSGQFKLAASRGEADAVFRGSILSLQAAPLAYRTSNLTAEDRITVVLELFFEDRQSGRIVWSNPSFVGTGDYPVTTVGVTESSRRNALTKLASDAAERAYRLMMSDF